MKDVHENIVRNSDFTAQSLVHALGVKGMARASYSFYNPQEEIDVLAQGIRFFLKSGK